MMTKEQQDAPASPAQPQGERELPPLPAPMMHGPFGGIYTGHQMREYARASLRASTQPTVSAEARDVALLLESLCAWLLHRFGPNSPEGKEAGFRLEAARAAIGTPPADNKENGK